MSLERSLLFAALAIQTRLVDPEDLGRVLARWADDPGCPALGDELVRLGMLRPTDRDLVEVMVDRLLDDHGTTAPSGSDRGPVPTADPEALDRLGPSSMSTVEHVPSDAPSATASFEGAPQAAGDAPRPDFEAGRFRPVRFHAQGGLGQIWLAIDSELDREVALKLLRPERADHDGWRERFRVEAHITGQLEHPGVAPVHGFGLGGDGRPYYAMRFIRGASFRGAIQKFHLADARPGRDHSERELALRGLLRRFLAVCDVIDHAHSRGIIHRDLKPDNILLGPHGETLVVDWGLARHWDGGGDGEPGQPTYVGTPAYMSPEAASGRPGSIAPSSDVYGLGATLYALLTGRKPVDAEDLGSTLDRVRRGDIPGPLVVNPRIPPALAAICRKAMHLDSIGRYPTPAALSADLERWLADEPVSVFPDPPLVRILRWAKRHLTLVASIAALALTTIVALAIIAGVVSYQRQIAERAEDEAIAQAERADRARREAEEVLAAGMTLIDELVSIADRRLDSSSSVEQRRELLEPGRTFLRQALERLSEAREARTQVALLARRLANLHRLLAEYDEAEGLYAEAVAVLLALVEQFPADDRLADLLAETRTDRAEARRMAGRVREAASLFREILDDASRRAAEQPDREDLARTELRARYSLGIALLEIGQLEEAGSLAQEAVDRYEPLARAALPAIDPDAIGRGDGPAVNALIDQLVLIDMLRTRAEIAALDGLPDAAEEQLDRADAVAAGARDRLGTLPIANLDLFDTDIDRDRARLLLPRDDRRDEARSLADGAVSEMDRLLDGREEQPTYREALADALSLRSRLAVLDDRPADAEDDAGRARTLLDALVAESPQVPSYRSLLGEVLETLGRAARLRDEPELASSLLREAEQRQAEALAINPDHPRFDARRRSHRRAIAESD